MVEIVPHQSVIFRFEDKTVVEYKFTWNQTWGDAVWDEIKDKWYWRIFDFMINQMYHEEDSDNYSPSKAIIVFHRKKDNRQVEVKFV